MRWIRLLIIQSILVSPAAGQSVTHRMVDLENNYRAHPRDYVNYQGLSFLISAEYERLTVAQRKEIRDILGVSSFSHIAIAPPSERGTWIAIQGQLSDKNAVPIPNAKVVVFQTDGRGYYSPTDSILRRMNEADARLFGVLHTDDKGRFEIQSIQPANYPRPYEGRYVPQHVHLNISAEGFRDLKLLVVFDDDPSIKDKYWQDWAKRMNFPIMKLIMIKGITQGHA